MRGIINKVIRNVKISHEWNIENVYFPLLSRFFLIRIDKAIFR